MVGPFIFADHLGPERLAAGRRIDIDAHPHIGLSTVTYLFAGRMVHRDSTGAVATIEPGAVNWMTAGSGICHTERTHPDDAGSDRSHHGLQTWVALPAEAEDGEPSFQHADAADIPDEVLGGVRVRLAAGSGWGMASPVPGSSPLVLAELSLADGASVEVDASHPERAVLAVDGDLFLDGHRVPAGRLAVLARDSSPTLTGVGRVMVLGGDPVGERRIWWNFVHSDSEAIEAAKDRWRNQSFPRVPGDHEPWVPLPG